MSTPQVGVRLSGNPCQVQNFERVRHIISAKPLASQVKIFDPKPGQVASSPKKICHNLGSGSHNHRKYLLAPVQKLGKCKNLLLCANIIVQILDQSQVNISDPKPQ